MTTPERRQVLYSKMLRFMIDHKVNSIPADLPEVCARAGVDLVPASKISRDIGMPVDDIFALWGNLDGTTNSFGGRYRITYNDAQPMGRMRFTICEELAHIIYGHIDDPEFSVDSQSYSNDKYALYDEEARLGAGFLICHPKFFYTYERYLMPQHLSELCGISLQCAKARHEIYLKYKPEITANMTYQFTGLPRSKVSVRKIVGR